VKKLLFFLSAIGIMTVFGGAALHAQHDAEATSANVEIEAFFVKRLAECEAYWSKDQLLPDQKEELAEAERNGVEFKCHELPCAYEKLVRDHPSADDRKTIEQFINTVTSPAFRAARCESIKSPDADVVAAYEQRVKDCVKDNGAKKEAKCGSLVCDWVDLYKKIQDPKAKGALEDVFDTHLSMNHDLKKECGFERPTRN
jgi:hypothetical protein